MKLISLFVIGVGVVHAEDVCGVKQLAPVNTCWPVSPNLKPNAQTDYTKDAATCCALCSNTGGCAGWTWGFDALGPPGRWSCRLKSAITGNPTVQNCTSGYSGAPPSKKPHILYILADDFGWADADWHHPSSGSTDPLATPNMTALIASGIELDQHYAYKFCSPTRSAIQSGRNPIHVNVQNYQPTVWDYVDPTGDTDSGYAGISRNMTTLADIMKRGGYKTHFAGKWDVGMAHKDMTPRARGYDTSLFYFHHDNDYWTSRVRASDTVKQCPNQTSLFVDLWQQDEHFDGPAVGLNNSAELCTAKDKPYPTDPITGAPMDDGTCRFEDALFHRQIMNTIASHDVSQPLFVFWAAHTIHGPLQVPEPQYRLYRGLDDDRRARYLAMVRWLDTAVGQTVDLLKEKNMYENTLIVFTSDNGGPVYFGGGGGANNFPLRGGKTSNYQGGIRVNAWAGGGLIPAGMRGKKLTGLGAVWDWYATFAELAGEDTMDHTAAAAGLPPVDSVSLWPYLSGAQTVSPRTTLPIGSTSCESGDPNDCVNDWGWGDVKTIVAGLIEDMGQQGLWKLLLGEQTMDGWQGPMYPNSSTQKNDFTFTDPFFGHCGAAGCLFRIDTDPTEHHDLLGHGASPNASIVARAAAMMMKLKKQNATTFSPERGPGEADKNTVTASCKAALDKYGGFFGPFLDG